MPTLNPEEQQTVDSLKRGLKHLDFARNHESYVGGIVGGALTGALIGYFAHRTEKGHRHIGKHALAGMGVGFGLTLISKQLLKGASSLGHQMERDIESGRYHIDPVTHEGFFADQQARRAAAAALSPMGMAAPPAPAAVGWGHNPYDPYVDYEYAWW